MGFDIVDREEKGYRIPYPEGEVLKEVTFGAKFCGDNIKKAMHAISENHQNVVFYQAYLDYRNADVKRTVIGSI